MKYFHWERPFKRRSWEGVDWLYVPLNIKNIYWVALVVDVHEWYLNTFDLGPTTTPKEKMMLLLESFRIMVPKILKQSKKI